jgi:hypothetical protein
VQAAVEQVIGNAKQQEVHAMAMGQAIAYNAGIKHLLESATPDWDDATGNFAFALLDKSYVPDVAHATWGDVSVHETASSSYAPIAVGSRTIVASGGNVYLDSADANFGADVTISARYLVCVQSDPVALQGTDKLIFYVDLNSGGAGNVSSSASTFNAQAPADGWLQVARAA